MVGLRSTKERYIVERKATLISRTMLSPLNAP